MTASHYDVFLCHAEEDRARFAEPLQGALEARGVKVWSERAEIQVGDDVGGRIDDGLRQARFGVLILSQRLFTHRPELGEMLLPYWTRCAVGALVNQELVSARVRLLPVRCDLTAAELTARSPLLAARVSVGWELGLEAVANRIAAAVRAERRGEDRSAAGSPVYNLPVRRAQRLYGRQADLEKLEELLMPGGAERVAVSLTGMVGVGKTELALHLVDRLAAQDLFPGGIFWFDAEQPDLTSTWGGPIAQELAISGKTVGERAASALRFAGRGAPVLLVLNNVESWTKVSVPRPLPGGRNVSLLVTTRNAFLGNDFAHHTIDCLAPAAARALLSTISGRELDEGVEALLDTLGGHTLAIELAGAYLHELVTVTPAEYLARLRAGRPVEGEVCQRIAYERTAAEAFEAAWTGLDPGAQRALRTAACFDSSEASLPWLQRCGVTEEDLRGLRRFHLMAVSGERWRIHRLVRGYVRRRGEAAPRAAAQAAFVTGIAQIVGEIGLIEGYQVYVSGRAHLECALELAEVVWASEPRWRSALADRVGTAAHSAGDYPRARQLMEQALATNLAAFGDPHPCVAAARNNLALVLKELSETSRARRLLEQALDSDRATFGDADPRVATRRSNLAIVLQDLGELRGARELLEQAVVASVAAMGERHPSVATTRSNLAGVLLELGELSQARQLLEQALDSELTAPGGDPCSATACRSNLALVLKRLGEYPRARALLEEVLAANLAVLGEAHPSVSVLRFNLAGICEEVGDLATAMKLYTQSLASDEHSLGADNPSTAYTRARRAWVYALLGDRVTARREIARAKEAVRDEPPDSRYRTAIKVIARTILDTEKPPPRPHV